MWEEERTGQPTWYLCFQPHLLCLVCNILPQYNSLAETVCMDILWFIYPSLSAVEKPKRPVGNRRLWIKLRWWDLSYHRWVFHTEVDSFCLQLQYLNTHQCNTQLLQATDSSSDSVCECRFHIWKGHMLVLFTASVYVCVPACSCFCPLLLETEGSWCSEAWKVKPMVMRQLYWPISLSQHRNTLITGKGMLHPLLGLKGASEKFVAWSFAEDSSCSRLGFAAHKMDSNCDLRFLGENVPKMFR